MKAVLVILMLVAAAFAWADDKTIPASDLGEVITGEVVEVIDVESYTYLLVKTEQGQTWAAVVKVPVKKGATVTIDNDAVMEDFQSPALSRIFKTVVFGRLRTAPAAVAAAHANAAETAADAQYINVAKATGPNAYAVAEIMGNAADLKDKPVVVRGQVVKYGAGIMGKNWIHLRDGSGAAGDKTDDVLVTTNDAAKVGDIVTVKGVVHIDRDFGAGYVYKAIVEEATLQR